MRLMISYDEFCPSVLPICHSPEILNTILMLYGVNVYGPTFIFELNPLLGWDLFYQNTTYIGLTNSDFWFVLKKPGFEKRYYFFRFVSFPFLDLFVSENLTFLCFVSFLVSYSYFYIEIGLWFRFRELLKYFLFFTKFLLFYMHCNEYFVQVGSKLLSFRNVIFSFRFVAVS
jgi:hypothetical protein